MSKYCTLCVRSTWVSGASNMISMQAPTIYKHEVKREDEVIMRAKKWVSTAVALTLVSSMAVACSSKTEKPGATPDPGKPSGKPQEIKINYSAEPPALDSSKATSSPAFTMLMALNEGLYRTDKDGKPTPALAKELPQVSADGLTYTFKLRDNLVWYDGTPLKASDFVAAYRRTLDPATKAQYSFMLEWIKGGKEIKAAKTPEDVKKAQEALAVKAIDDKTLEIKLVKPVGFFTSLTAFPVFYPQKEEMVKALGDKYGADADKLVGAGPYKLESWSHDQTLTFVKNDKYWDAANVKLTKITVNIVKDTNTGLNLYETNQADLTEIKGDQIKLYEGKPDLTKKPELVTAYLQFQQKKNPIFANTKIRQALGMSIDRKAFVDTVLANGSVPSRGYNPVGILDGAGGEYTAKAGDVQAKFDAAKAKTLLAEGLKELNMTSLPKFKILGDDTEGAKKSLEFIISQWKTNLGIEVIAEPVPNKLRIDRSHNKDFEVVLSLWGADYNDPMTFMDMWISGGEFNETDWSNKTYDDLIAKADVEKDPAKRAQMFVDAEKVLMQEVPISPLYHRTKMFVKKPHLDGIILPSFGGEFELKWASVK